MINKVIVTGATGFIGRFLVRELVEKKVEVISIVRSGTTNIGSLDNLPIRIVECNMSDYNNIPTIIKDRDIDAVFHIAWQGVAGEHAKDVDIQLSNIKYTLDLIDSMYQMNIKTFVGCGSMHEAEALIEMSQDKTVNNMGFMYKSAKTSAHWMGKAKAGNYGIRFFWPLINTYGEEEKSPRLINTMIRKILKGESPELSAGNQYYDFVHVKDVARALYLIADRGVDGTNYTIGSGEAKKLKEFLKIVGDITNKYREGKYINLDFGKITSNVVSLPIETFNVDKLYSDTGFIPSISFSDGINRTVEWIIKEQRR